MINGHHCLVLKLFMGIISQFLHSFFLLSTTFVQWAQKLTAPSVDEFIEFSCINVVRDLACICWCAANNMNTMHCNDAYNACRNRVLLCLVWYRSIVLSGSLHWPLTYFWRTWVKQLAEPHENQQLPQRSTKQIVILGMYSVIIWYRFHWAVKPRWCRGVKMLSALLAFCVGDPQITTFPHLQGALMRSLDAKPWCYLCC